MINTANAPDLDVPARFLGLGLVGLAAMALLAPVGVPLLAGSFYDARLLAFVHLNTLGAVGSILLGASYQMAPVVLESPLPSPRLARLSFWAYLAGGIGLLSGLMLAEPRLLVGGGLSLAVAFAIYALLLAAMIVRAPHRDVVAWHVAAALACLVVGVTLGATLAFNKGSGFLGAHALGVLAAHATLMVAGWIGLMLAGVSYRLVAMFTLAHEALWVPGAWAELAMTTGGTALTALGLACDHAWMAQGGAALLLGGALLYAALLGRMELQRRRRGVDVLMPFALVAAAAGVAAAALLAWGHATNLPPGHAAWIAATWLGIAGVAETAIQGFLYKILTFLTWLHRYAPRAGRERVPKLEDLYDRRLAFVGFGFWCTGLLAGTASAWTPGSSLAVAAGWLLAVGLVIFLVNAVGIATHGCPHRAALQRRFNGAPLASPITKEVHGHG